MVKAVTPGDCSKVSAEPKATIVIEQADMLRLELHDLLALMGIDELFKPDETVHALPDGELLRTLDITSHQLDISLGMVRLIRDYIGKTQEFLGSR